MLLCSTKHKSGFTLLEIMVSAVLLSIGIVAAISLLSWAKVRIRESENKSRALAVASAKMEEYMAQAYSKLGTEQSPDAEQYVLSTVAYLGTGELMREDGRRGDFHWNSIISQQAEGGENQETIRIPYKRIEVAVEYEDEPAASTKVSKAVRMVNLKAYPYMHTEWFVLNQDTSCPPPSSVPFNFDNPGPANYRSIGPGLKLEVSYEVPKDILIFYNVAISADNPSLFSDAEDTVYTSCFLRRGDQASLNWVQEPVETRTPIKSQPIINNAVALTKDSYLGVLPSANQAHEIEVKWFKQRNVGTVRLREANIILIATDHLREGQ
jgi:prepilin-type N-terminal cleavage/methylation domain-containing protein